MRYPRIILAVDPGTKHLAFCVHDGHVRKSATFAPVRQVKGARPETVLADIRSFATLFGTLLDQEHPDCVVIERFMYRPGVGVAGEFINILIGQLLVECDRRRIETLLVMPAQHKTWLQRTMGFEVQDYPGFDLPTLTSEHERDAASLALFVRREWYRRATELRIQAAARAA
jgi:hypothetical protein